MTMLSFRLEAEAAREAQAWAERLGLDRSELLRVALRRYLNQLASEHEAAILDDLVPSDDSERSLSEIADWGLAEDWSDWADAKG